MGELRAALDPEGVVRRDGDAAAIAEVEGHQRRGGVLDDGLHRLRLDLAGLGVLAEHQVTYLHRFDGRQLTETE